MSNFGVLINYRNILKSFWIFNELKALPAVIYVGVFAGTQLPIAIGMHALKSDYDIFFLLQDLIQ